MFAKKSHQNFASIRKKITSLLPTLVIMGTCDFETKTKLIQQTLQWQNIVANSPVIHVISLRMFNANSKLN